MWIQLEAVGNHDHEMSATAMLKFTASEQATLRVVIAFHQESILLGLD